MGKPEIIGGHERRALNIENVVPLNFSKSDPFWDIPIVLDLIDKGCKSGEISDLIIIIKKEKGIVIKWRGDDPLTTALGMLEYAKELLYREKE